MAPRCIDAPHERDQHLCQHILSLACSGIFEETLGRIVPTLGIPHSYRLVTLAGTFAAMLE